MWSKLFRFQHRWHCSWSRRFRLVCCRQYHLAPQWSKTAATPVSWHQYLKHEGVNEGVASDISNKYSWKKAGRCGLMKIQKDCITIEHFSFSAVKCIHWWRSFLFISSPRSRNSNGTQQDTDSGKLADDTEALTAHCISWTTSRKTPIPLSG